jgi:hypothetical protein
MNCREFERTIIDLGADHLSDAPAPARALAHAESCARCAALLDRELRMTAGLQAVAVEESAINAPERVREALRAAFVRGLGQQAPAAAPLAVPPRSARQNSIWKMAAAAMLLLFAAGTALWMRERMAEVNDRPNHILGAAANRSAPQSPPGKTPEGPPEKLMEKPVNPRPASGIHSSSAALRAAGHGRRRKPKVKEGDREAGELFQLTSVAKSGATEFTQTVRVEISRSTLLTMGLPVNIDRGEGPIKADIIIGEDGVARAVRILSN